MITSQEGRNKDIAKEIIVTKVQGREGHTHVNMAIHKTWCVNFAHWDFTRFCFPIGGNRFAEQVISDPTPPPNTFFHSKHFLQLFQSDFKTKDEPTFTLWWFVVFLFAFLYFTFPMFKMVIYNEHYFMVIIWKITPIISTYIFLRVLKRVFNDVTKTYLKQQSSHRSSAKSGNWKNNCNPQLYSCIRN